MSDDPLDNNGGDWEKKSGWRVFTAEPSFADTQKIRMKMITPVYQCCRCRRHYRGVQGNEHMRFEIVLLRGHYYCLEHYQLARLELEYDKENPYPTEWKEKLIAEQIARHPEWKRQDHETRTQYAERMISDCHEKIRRLKERMSVSA